MEYLLTHNKPQLHSRVDWIIYLWLSNRYTWFKSYIIVAFIILSEKLLKRQRNKRRTAFIFGITAMWEKTNKLWWYSWIRLGHWFGGHNAFFFSFFAFLSGVCYCFFFFCFFQGIYIIIYHGDDWSWKKDWLNDRF